VVAYGLEEVELGGGRLVCGAGALDLNRDEPARAALNPQDIRTADLAESDRNAAAAPKDPRE
jgi:hypothetical protein